VSYLRIIAANFSASGGPSGSGGNVSAFADSPGVTIPNHLAGSCPAFVKPCATPLGMKTTFSIQEARAQPYRI
jgi:hypothetical protein